jgi:hypothetical protein
MREEFIRQVKQVAAERPNPDTWLPGELRIVHAVGGTLDVLGWWLQQSDSFPAERVAEILNRLIIAPSMETATAAEGAGAPRRWRPSRAS